MTRSPLPALTLSLLALVLVSCGRQDQTQGASETMSSQIIVGELDWKEVSDLPPGTLELGVSKAIADVDLPVMGSRCTGFLITDNILMTNHHCVPSERYAEGITVTFDHVKGTSKRFQERFDCSEFIGNDRELDYALLKCEGSPGTKYGHVSLSDSPAAQGTAVYIIQQNCDYYTDRDCDWTKKISRGQIVKVDNEYTHNADTLGGSSGSPVFDGHHTVVALHHAGLGNNGKGRGIENYAVPMFKVVAHIKDNFPEVSFATPNPSQGNNSFSTAAALKFESGKKATSQGAIQGKSEKDYYKFTLPQAGKVAIKLSFSHKVGDLDLKFFGSDKQTMATSQSTNNYETVEQELGAGTYYVAIYGYAGAQGPYEVSVELSQAQKDNDSLKTAQSVELPASFEEAIDSPTDKDFFTFNVDHGQVVRIALEFSHHDGDLDLFLYDRLGREITSSEGTSDQEVIEKSLSSGRYYVQVKGYRKAQASYTLTID